MWFLSSEQSCVHDTSLHFQESRAPTQMIVNLCSVYRVLWEEDSSLNTPASPQNSANYTNRSQHAVSLDVFCTVRTITVFMCCFPCPLASAWHQLAPVNLYAYLTSYINSHHATTVSCTLGVQYIIYSWATNFPHLPLQTRNPIENPGVCSSPERTGHLEVRKSIHMLLKVIISMADHMGSSMIQE